jgi:glucose-6-phosphate dehydrogenase assembly protein OpcA
MMIDLTDTTASKINSALIDSRRRSGSPAMGMVLTMIVVTDEASHYDALKAATEAAREHPSRILAVVGRPGRGEPRLDAEVRIGGESGPGEVVLLRLRGPLADHAESVALPLLLPDAPVVTWWPGAAPENPCKDPLGALAQRRVTDAAACVKPLEELGKRAAGYSPGDTDLSWTRLTTWRTLLAAALDDPYDTIRSVAVSAEADSPSAELMAVWLEMCLEVPVERSTSDGPGITGVTLHTGEGDISITRPDGRMAMLSRPGWPDRPVALHRRSTAELIAEELRRLDEDDVYGRTLQQLRAQRDGSSPARPPAGGSAGEAHAEHAGEDASGAPRKAPAKKASARKRTDGEA